MTEYQILIKKFVDKRITTEEKNKLEQWVKVHTANKVVFVNTIKALQGDNEVMFNADTAYSKFIKSTHKTQTKTFKLSPFYKYAALLVLAITIIGYSVKSYNTNTKINTIVNSETTADLLNKDVITITLSDGTTKVITPETISTLKDAKGRAIAKKGNNGLIFNNEVDNGTLVYNEIFVPNSKTLKLELSDGTLVWLNSGTRFKFPQNFKYAKDKRTVFLTGEAFFDVTKNKSKPFIVNNNNILVEVLGTQFNVSSYENDKSIATTLIEGAVNVFKKDNQNTAMQLSPGYQASFNKENGDLIKKAVDTDVYTSWINNKLIINNLKLSEIIFKLERKYDVIIINETHNMANGIYKGEFGDESIEEILKTIALSTPFKYEIKNNIIKMYN